jgi:hypothetical protein
MGRHRKSALVVPQFSPATEGSSSTEVGLAPFEEERRRYFDILTDPMDVSTDEEISENLGVTVSQIRKWRTDPSFIQVANVRFRENLASNTILVFKNLSHSAIVRNSISAARILLEIGGILKGTGGTTVQITGASPQGEATVDLSDEDLEAEIARLIADTEPVDVSFQQGKVTPVEASFEVVEEGSE